MCWFSSTLCNHIYESLLPSRALIATDLPYCPPGRRAKEGVTVVYALTTSQGLCVVLRID